MSDQPAPAVPPLSTRDRIVDVTAITLSASAALALAGAAMDTAALTGRELAWAIAVAAAGCAALWWRRHRPVAVAVVVAPMIAFTELVGAAALVALFTVTTRRRWPVTLGVASLYALAYVPYAYARPDPDLTVFGAVVFNTVALLVVVGVGLVVRARRASVARWRERVARASSEADRHAQRLREQERHRIARELHDVLAHRISLISLHAGALEIRPDLSTTEVERVAGTIRASAHQALEELREALGVLRTGTDGEDLRPQPGLVDLPRLVDECRSAGTPVEVDDALPERVAPPSVSRTAYRIVQEGLTNARKHAPGVPVHLRLDQTPAGELHVWLRNRLPRMPGPAIPGARSGLVGLAERVSLAGGRIDHGARRGADGEVCFHLEVWVPWPTGSES